MLRRWLSRCAAVLGLSLVGSVTMPGCADPDSEIFVLGVPAMTAGNCSVRPSGDALLLFYGTLDVSFRTEYMAPIIIGNQQIKRGNADLARAETGRVQLEFAEVTVENANESVVAEYSVPITGFVDAASGNDPAFGSAAVPLINSAVAKGARAELAADRTKLKRYVSKVKVGGHTLGGNEVTSGQFQFVTYLCYGCLVGFDASFDDPNVDGIDCAGTATAATTADPPCIVGQDSVVSCDQCRSFNSACTSPTN